MSVLMHVIMQCIIYAHSFFYLIKLISTCGGRIRPSTHRWTDRSSTGDVLPFKLAMETKGGVGNWERNWKGKEAVRKGTGVGSVSTYRGAQTRYKRHFAPAALHSGIIKSFEKLSNYVNMYCWCVIHFDDCFKFFEGWKPWACCPRRPAPRSRLVPEFNFQALPMKGWTSHWNNAWNN